MHTRACAHMHHAEQIIKPEKKWPINADVKDYISDYEMYGKMNSHF